MYSLDTLLSIIIIALLFCIVSLLTYLMERRDHKDLQRAHRALQAASHREWTELVKVRSQLAAARGELFAISQIEGAATNGTPTMFDTHVATAIEQSKQRHPAAGQHPFKPVLIEGGLN